jgi:hypothetical protein
MNPTQTQATEDPRCCPAELQVGDGVTTSWGGDCEPATVIAISSDRRIVTIQMDSYRVVSGTTCDGSAEYEYARNPEGSVHICRYYVRRGSRGRGFRAGSTHGIGVGLRGRRAWYNPSL